MNRKQALPEPGMYDDDYAYEREILIAFKYVKPIRKVEAK